MQMARPLGNAIPTPYHGMTFRSPLEARWAVFFDHMGITWTYEVEEFMVDGQYAQRPVLLSFEAETTRAACPACQWTGVPTRLLARLGAAGDAAETFAF